MIRRSSGIMVTLLACIGYLMFGVVSGLSAAANFFGRNPNHGRGSLGAIICVFCIWRIVSLLWRLSKVRKARRAVEDDEEKDDVPFMTSTSPCGPLLDDEDSLNPNCDPESRQLHSKAEGK